MCDFTSARDKGKKGKAMWSFKKKPRRKCLPQGRAQETLCGLRNKVFTMFEIQQISPRNVLKRGTPKCIFSTLFHHSHIYLCLAYLDFKNMSSPCQNVHQILIKQTNKPNQPNKQQQQQKIWLYSITSFS